MERTNTAVWIWWNNGPATTALKAQTSWLRKPENAIGESKDALDYKEKWSTKLLMKTFWRDGNKNGHHLANLFSIFTGR